MSRTSVAGAVAAAVALVACGTSPPALAGGGPIVGEAVIEPGDGGSTTAFVVRLPDSASCPGDSANDGYRVQSYMVPAAVDPTTITYNGLGPVPSVYGTYADFRQTLFDTDSNSFASAQTADASAPGQPGPIINLPEFDYAVYGPGDLPAGRYHIGLACTLLKDITNVWDAEVVVTAAPDDEPAQIRWTVVSGAADTDSNPPLAPVVVAGGIALIAGAVLVGRRRHHPRTTTRSSEEP